MTTNNGIKKKNIVLVFLTEFIRIWDVTNWVITSLLGFLLGMSIVSFDKYLFPLSIFMISTFFIMSLTFAMNNYYDADSDRGNPRRMSVNAIASGIISKKTGILLLSMFFIIPLIACSLLGDIKIILFCLLLLFMGWAYSAPPLRIKGRPILDVVWHFFGFFLYVLWGALIAGSFGLIIWLIAISVGLFSCIFQVCNHILDYTFDKETGTRTFAVWAGLHTARKTVKILIVIHILVILPIILMYSLSYIVTIVIVLIGIGIGFYKSKPKNVFHSTKRSFISFIFYFTISVYISCLFYHTLSDFNFPVFHFLNFNYLG